jgi:hypothetical protein
MAPLQDGQGVTSITVQPVQIVTGSNKCSSFFLQARTTLSIEARRAKQKHPRKFTSCAIFSESNYAFREEFRERALSRKAEVWIKSAWL